MVRLAFEPQFNNVQDSRIRGPETQLGRKLLRKCSKVTFNFDECVSNCREYNDQNIEEMKCKTLETVELVPTIFPDFLKKREKDEAED